MTLRCSKKTCETFFRVIYNVWREKFSFDFQSRFRMTRLPCLDDFTSLPRCVWIITFHVLSITYYHCRLSRDNFFCVIEIQLWRHCRNSMSTWQITLRLTDDSDAVGQINQVLLLVTSLLSRFSNTWWFLVRGGLSKWWPYVVTFTHPPPPPPPK